MKFGILTKHSTENDKNVVDFATGLPRTGLNVYLKTIYPEVDDWVYNEPITISKKKLTPLYRSETLKMIVEMDDASCFQNFHKLLQSDEETMTYDSAGYTVVRIPYFLQLTNDVVEALFDIEVDIDLFVDDYVSLNYSNCPSTLCNTGLQRMAMLFCCDQYQYGLNAKWLIDQNDDDRTGINDLLKAIDACINDDTFDYGFMFTHIFRDQLNKIYDYADRNRQHIEKDEFIKRYHFNTKKLLDIFYMAFCYKQEEYNALDELDVED